MKGGRIISDAKIEEFKNINSSFLGGYSARNNMPISEFLFR